MAFERQKQIGASQHDRFGPLFCAQAAPNRKEDFALLLSDTAGICQFDVVTVHLIQGSALR
jgi:hypothetical protein